MNAKLEHPAAEKVELVQKAGWLFCEKPRLFPAGLPHQYKPFTN